MSAQPLLCTFTEVYEEQDKTMLSGVKVSRAIDLAPDPQLAIMLVTGPGGCFPGVHEVVPHARRMHAHMLIPVSAVSNQADP